MKVSTIYISFIFLLFSLIINAQTIQTHTEIPIVEEVVGASPEEMPEFPGGIKAMQNFIKANAQYPKVITEKGIYGTVYIRFTVDIDGSIKDIKVLKGIIDCPECDNEAKRLCSIMPKWKPGKVNGTLTPVYLNYPLKFQAQ